MIGHYFNNSSTIMSLISAARDLEIEMMWERIKSQSATLTISAIQIIIHIIDRLTPRPILLNCLRFDSSHKFQIWRMFTHALVHNQWYDLVSNLYIQLLLGRHLETYISSLTFLIIYIFSVHAGAYGFYFVQSRLVSGAHVPAFVILTVHGVISIARLQDSFNMIELIQSACFVLEVTAVLELINNQHHYACHKVVGLIIGSAFARALVLKKKTLIFDVKEYSYRSTIIFYLLYFFIFKLESFVILSTRPSISYIHLVLISLGVSFIVWAI